MIGGEFPMPVTPTYPGVYIQEIPSGAHPITGVATSIGAFVDFFPQGPVNEAVHVLGLPDFERQFGGLDTRSEASYAVQQFFLNGGTDAYVVRVTSSTSGKAAQSAAIVLMDKGGGSSVLLATAASPGQWGNNLRIDIDYGTTDPTRLFNLTATEVSLVGAKPQVVATEAFRNLSLDSTQPNYAPNVVTNGSQLITISVTSGATTRPAQTGTVSAGFAAISRPWGANTVFHVGDTVIDANGNLVKAAAVSGSGETGTTPTWSKDVGTQVTDDSSPGNGVTWQVLPTGLLFLPQWKQNAAYKAGDAILDANGNTQVVTAAGTSGATVPTWHMTIGGNVTDGTVTWTLQPVFALSVQFTGQLQVLLNNVAFSQQISLSVTQPNPITWAWLAATLQSLIRGVDPSLANATVNVIGGSATLAYLQIKPGTNNPADVLTLKDVGGSTLATHLNLAPNVQQYALGSGIAVQAQAFPGSPAAPQPGVDGIWDPGTDAAGMTGGLIGDPVAKSGMYALLDVDLFNILCIPVTMRLPDTNAAQVATNATALCTERRSFYILDPPQQAGNRDTVTGIMTWLDQNATLRSRNAAIYFPRPDIADPLNNFQLRATAPSGTIAGVYARTDVTRGVWKAPAGTEATLAGVQALEYRLIDGENGVLNPLAINCLRSFPVYGNICWGARTLNGADQIEDDYKYVPMRRLALFLEESLYRGLKWVVFEPNDEPLWAQIRLNVTGFMQDLFRQGAFQGGSPQQAYFVKCDNQTTTSLDQANGIVNIVVGFAPLKPAEFVIIQIQQIAGQPAP
jgi:phage tail sheath protein FI